jgi:leader peptidase (prepilin peptidase)/N-methyltransferase
MINRIALSLLFACWGSFLNVVSYRLIHNKSLLGPRSCCPLCNHLIYWHDNIPVMSWLFLGGKCRHCKGTISVLYPFIEILSILLFNLLFWYVPLHYCAAYFIFFSALIVIIRSDLESMLISQFVTLFLIPVGLGAAYLGYVPISIGQSIVGTVIGYASLWSVNYIFNACTKKQGIGEGDIDLLAFIGSFTGVVGVWMSVLVGSLLGSLIGVLYIILYKSSGNTKIPFGPFLSVGAILFVLCKPLLLQLLLPF